MPGRSDRLSGSPGGRALIGAAAVIAIATVLGLVLLWPGHVDAPRGDALGGPSRSATVTRIDSSPCGGPTAQQCRVIDVKISKATSSITLGPVATNLPTLERGTKVRVARTPRATGQPAGGEAWQFVSVDRRGGLTVLAVCSLLLALLVIRVRGLLAAVGVGASLALVLVFTIPAILSGGSALLIALVTASAVMFVTVGLTHGLSAASLAAVLGITATLLVTCAAAELATHLVALDGQSNELAQYLAQRESRLSLQGIVLAGMLIGALGVLADTAVTQASAVMALRRANPDLAVGDLYREASIVGRDHLSATIHTLVLAYAGTALPLLLLMRSGGVGVTDALVTQDVAEPVAAALVGCLGLVVAVPITTILSAVLIARTPQAALASGHHHH